MNSIALHRNGTCQKLAADAADGDAHDVVSFSLSLFFCLSHSFYIYIYRKMLGLFCLGIILVNQTQFGGSIRNSDNLVGQKEHRVSQASSLLCNTRRSICTKYECAPHHIIIIIIIIMCVCVCVC